MVIVKKTVSICSCLCFILAIAAATIVSCNDSERKAASPIYSFRINTPDSIQFIYINNKAIAYYEINVENVSPDTIYVKRLQIKNAVDSSVLYNSESPQLLSSFNESSHAPTDSIAAIDPGKLVTIYIELEVRDTSTTHIIHELHYTSSSERSGEFTKQWSEASNTILSAPLLLGSPLKAGIWTAIFDPSWERGHRRVVYSTNQQAKIPGRYAIDFMKLNEKAAYSAGDEDEIGNWFGYNEDVLAVQDGIVSSVNDNFPESSKISMHRRYSADSATGNYISIEIGKNLFAFYEHLKPKSIKVKPGQQVKKGDVIASIGFTGQTTGPHLHFHIADHNSALDAEGKPFVFESFEWLGSYPKLEGFGKLPWVPLPATVKPNRLRERPAPNSVIRFKAP